MLVFALRSVMVPVAMLLHSVCSSAGPQIIVEPQPLRVLPMRDVIIYILPAKYVTVTLNAILGVIIIVIF